LTLFRINDGLARCVPYTGSVCSQYLHNRTVLLRPGHSLNQMEMLLRRAFAIVASSASISPQCHRFTVPLLCYQSFQVCEQKDAITSGMPELGIPEQKTAIKDDLVGMYHAKHGFQLRQVLWTAVCFTHCRSNATFVSHILLQSVVPGRVRTARTRRLFDGVHFGQTEPGTGTEVFVADLSSLASSRRTSLLQLLAYRSHPRLLFTSRYCFDLVYPIKS
jgi:hypothetical protein